MNGCNVRSGKLPRPHSLLNPLERYLVMSLVWLDPKIPIQVLSSWMKATKEARRCLTPPSSPYGFFALKQQNTLFEPIATFNMRLFIKTPQTVGGSTRVFEEPSHPSSGGGCEDIASSQHHVSQQLADRITRRVSCPCYHFDRMLLP